MLNPPQGDVRSKENKIEKLIIYFIKISNFANKYEWYYKIGL